MCINSTVVQWSSLSPLVQTRVLMCSWLRLTGKPTGSVASFFQFRKIARDTRVAINYPNYRTKQTDKEGNIKVKVTIKAFLKLAGEVVLVT